MEGSGGDGGSQIESQGEWSQNFEWMQEMAAPIFQTSLFNFRIATES